MSAAVSKRAVEKRPVGRINIRLIPGTVVDFPRLLFSGTSRKDEQCTEYQHHLHGGPDLETEVAGRRYFFAFAHRFFAAAAILARASGLITLLAFTFGAAADF